MKISVLAVGKMRDKGLRTLCEEYRGRLDHHVQTDAVAVKKERRGQPDAIIDAEGDRLAEATPKGAVTVALTEEGTSLRSVEVAQKINQWMVQGRSDIVFYVGGAHGLSPQLKADAQRQWSLSRMTFPHDIARMLLWEQLYRAMSIIRREPYHK